MEFSAVVIAFNLVSHPALLVIADDAAGLGGCEPLYGEVGVELDLGDGLGGKAPVRCGEIAGMLERQHVVPSGPLIGAVFLLTAGVRAGAAVEMAALGQLAGADRAAVQAAGRRCRAPL